jgi:hypothetical protein
VLVAAPVVVTAAIVVVSVLSTVGPDHPARPAVSKPATPWSQSPAASLLADGWYVVHPLYAGSADKCLSILPDNSFMPTVTQDRCDPEDELQRMRFVSAGKGTYTIKAQDLDDKIKCVAVDSSDDQARLHLRPCVQAERRQLFTLTAVGASSPTTYRLASLIAQGPGSCVGVDATTADESPQAIQTTCASTGFRGYSLAPTAAPETAGR